MSETKSPSIPFVRLCDETYAQLGAMADAAGISKRKMITSILENYVANPFPLEPIQHPQRTLTACPLDPQAMAVLKEQAENAGLPLGVAYRQIIIQAIHKE